MEHDGEIRRLGFFTTRWVRANDSEDAEMAAVELIRNDSSLVKLTMNDPETDPSPMIYLKGLETVSWLTYVRRRPGSGYSFFLESDSASSTETLPGESH